MTTFEICLLCAIVSLWFPILVAANIVSGAMHQQQVMFNSHLQYLTEAYENHLTKFRDLVKKEAK